MPKMPGLLWILVLAPLSTTAAQTPCTSLAPHPEAVAFIEDPSYGFAVARVDGYTYFGVADGKVKVVDTRDPLHPEVVETLLEDDPDTWRLQDLAVGGGRLYARVSRSGQPDKMDVFDLSDPASPVRLEAQLPPGQYADLFTASGDMVAFAATTEKLTVLDVQDPAHPQTLGSLALPGGIRSIDSRGDRVYVALGPRHQDPTQALVVVAVDPTPRILKQIDLAASPRTVSVDGSYAYITTYISASGDLLVVDLSDINAPVVYRSPIPYVQKFIAAETRGYGVGPGLWFYDLSNPVDPRLTGNTRLPLAAGLSTSGSLEAHDVVAQDGYAFVVRQGGGLSIYDIDDAESALDGMDVLFPATGVLVSDGVTAFAGHGNTLETFSVADPTSPQPLGSVGLAGRIQALTLDGSILLAGTADGTRGKVVFIEVGTPSAPRVVHEFALDDWIQVEAILRHGNRIYVTGVRTWETVLAVIDASLATPKLENVIYLEPWNTFEGTTWEGPRLAADGQCLYIMSYRGFRVLGLDLPNAPTPLALWEEDGHLSGDIAVRGSTVFLTLNTRHEWYSPPGYVEGQSPGLRVIDVSDPEQPEEIGRFSTVNGANDLEIANQLAYVQVTSCGIQAVDLTDPRFPADAGYWLTPGDSRFSVVDKYIWAFPQEESGLAVLPLLCGVVPVRLLAFSARWAEGRAVLTWKVAENDPGVQFRLTAVSGSDRREVPYVMEEGAYRAEDFLAGSARMSYELHAQGRDGTWTYLGERTVVAGVSPPPPLGAYPNPFRTSTTVHYRVETAGSVTVTVFDAAGRQVTRLVDRDLDPAEYTVTWDGRDDRARPVAAGVYFLRLKTPMRSCSATLVIRP